MNGRTGTQVVLVASANANVEGLFSSYKDAAQNHSEPRQTESNESNLRPPSPCAYSKHG